MYRAGVAAILSQLVRDGRLSVVGGFAVEAPKTAAFAEAQGHGSGLRAGDHRDA